MLANCCMNLALTAASVCGNIQKEIVNKRKMRVKRKEMQCAAVVIYKKKKITPIAFGSSSQGQKTYIPIQLFVNDIC